MPDCAMVLAAGIGKRMRPLTETRPKPLVELAGKALLDYALDALERAGVARAAVNVHYLADMIEEHVAGRAKPEIVLSDERALLLDTGGGIANALPRLGEKPFFLINSDTVWTDGAVSTLGRLAEAWRDNDMDALLLLTTAERSLGYAGKGDFMRASNGRLRRREGEETGAAVYIGTAVIHPRLFANAPEGPFSLNLLFDRAIAAGRLYGLMHEGFWMHVGTPAALKQAEDYLARQGGSESATLKT